METTLFNQLQSVLEMSDSPSKLQRLEDHSVMDLQILSRGLRQLAKTISTLSCKVGKERSGADLSNLNISDYTSSLNEEYRDDVISKLLGFQQRLLHCNGVHDKMNILRQCYVETYIAGRDLFDTCEREGLYHFYNDLGDLAGLNDEQLEECLGEA